MSSSIVTLILLAITLASASNQCWHRTPPPEGLDNFLVGCILFKNEEPYLKEWLVYHQIAGFDHMYMYNHMSTDRSLDVLQPFIDQGFVTVVPWDGAPGKVQTDQVNHCWATYAPHSMWTAIFDVDEFIVSFYDEPHNIQAGFLTRVLQKHYQWKAAIELYRANFDSNGHKVPPAGLVMDAYTSRWTDENTAAKLINQYKYIKYVGGHSSQPVDGWPVVDARMRDVWKQGRTFVNAPLRINHYITRSFDECSKKMNQTAFPGSWRSSAVGYCEKAMVGRAEYHAFDHYFDDWLPMHFSKMVSTCMSYMSGVYDK